MCIHFYLNLTGILPEGMQVCYLHCTIDYMEAHILRAESGVEGTPPPLKLCKTETLIAQPTNVRYIQYKVSYSRREGRGGEGRVG